MVFLLLFGLYVLGEEPQLVAARPAETEVELFGYTRARERLKVTAEVGARCVRILADMGETVPEDGVFAELDDTFVRLELDANLARRALLKDRVAYLEKEAARFRKLLERATLSQADFDELQQRLSQSRLELQALVVDARAMEERLRRHRITVPGSWRIIERSVAEGDWVSAGRVLAEAGDYSSLVVPFSLDAAALAAVQNQPLSLSLPDHDVTVPARVLRVSPAFDPETRKTRVDLLIEKDMPQWRGGIRTRLVLRLPAEQGFVTLPPDALEQRYETWWATREDGTRLRVHHLGAVAGGWIRVKSPALKPGDRFRRSARQ